MDIPTQILIRNNPNIYQFLRENSYWYKYLNRNPSSIKELEKRMKEKYKLTTEARLEKLNERMGLIHSFMDMMK